MDSIIFMAAVPNLFELWTPKYVSTRFRRPLPYMFGLARGPLRGPWIPGWELLIHGKSKEKKIAQ